MRRRGKGGRLSRRGRGMKGGAKRKEEEGKTVAGGEEEMKGRKVGQERKGEGRSSS